MPRPLVTSRLERLVALLDMDLTWRLHKVSDGQRRRAQLLLKLLRPSALLLMDEVTTDLDVVSRQALLQFLREECEQRGATVVYSTHILDGLDDWPSHVLHLEEGSVSYVGELGAAPGYVPPGCAAGEEAGGASGSLFGLVKRWLVASREAQRARREAEGPAGAPADAPAVSATPAPMTTPATSMDSTSCSTGAGFGSSRFDRFGGASRQSAYM